MAISKRWSPDLYNAAYRFAAEAHRGQTVPGTDGLPYIMHISMVAMETMTALTIESFDAPDLAVQCALLHDTIEDTAIDHGALAAEVGVDVADGVSALSKNLSLPKAERMADSLRRIREQPREVWIVKLADRITNLAPPPARWTQAKRTRYRDEARDILAALGSASPYLAGRMESKIEAYAGYLVPGS